MKPNLKFMHVIDSAGIYGAEIMLLNLMEEHKNMGIDSLLYSIEPSDNPSNVSLAEVAAKRGLSAVKSQSTRGYSLLLNIHRFAEEHGIVLIHSHGYKGNILLGCIPRFMRKMPVISTVHGWTSVRRFTKMWFYTLLDKFFLKRMDAIVNVNTTTVMDAGKADRFVVENGIPPLKFEPESVMKMDTVTTEFCKDDFIVGAISRLSEEKGIAYLIKTVAILAERGNNVKAVVIGEGPQKGMLQKLIIENNLSDRVLLAGYKNNAFNYLPIFDAFVLPSLTEGLPITILEAMQAGVPIIATNVGGVPDVLGKGSYGIIVEPGNSELLADAVSRVFSDADFAERMARDAKNAVLSEYTSRRMAKKYLNVYEAVLNKWKQ